MTASSLYVGHWLSSAPTDTGRCIERGQARRSLDKIRCPACIERGRSSPSGIENINFVVCMYSYVSMWSPPCKVGRAEEGVVGGCCHPHIHWNQTQTIRPGTSYKACFNLVGRPHAVSGREPRVGASLPHNIPTQHHKPVLLLQVATQPNSTSRSPT